MLILVALGLSIAGLPGLSRPAIGADGEAFTNFETEPVRPLARSADGRHLYALNIPDDRLEVFAIEPAGLRHLASTFVCLRPVALALRDDQELWISCHLSDAVVQIDVADPAAPALMRTIAVGDEPRDLVVAGPNRDRLFVATARRDGVLDDASHQASVWMIELETPDELPKRIDLPSMKVRALAASPDGRRVYAAVFHSGNRTTTVGEMAVEAAGGPPLPDPPGDAEEPPPRTSLIVQQQADGSWRDEAGGDWSEQVPFDLPDQDVFELLAAAPDAPVLGRRFSGLGTVLFNMAFRPGSAELWVSNTEARNLVRFEPKLRGHAVDSRVTRLSLDGGAVAEAIDLNPQLLPRPEVGSDALRDQALAQPTDLIFDPTGQRAYVAAFQSGKVGVLDGAGRLLERIDVGFGPSGLALDAPAERLFVLERLDASISVVDLDGRRVVQTVRLGFDPTPEVIRRGRPFLYDARATSLHGDMACASCHVFADFDQLAWDLGEPGGAVLDIPFELTHENFLLKPRDFHLHPMKGPMTTQSFRGMEGAGPMHWRADRYGPEGSAGDELASFRQFNAAFVSLNGRDERLALADIDAMARFLFSIRYPPNPHQRLDRQLEPEAHAGAELFSGEFPIDSGIVNCENCHSLPLGTNGRVNFEGDRSSQAFKSPHLRNVYQKMGRIDEADARAPSGFGLIHDGSIGSIQHFLVEAGVFEMPAEDEEDEARQRRELAAFVLAFDTGMAPAVGWQASFAGALDGHARQGELETVIARAAEGDCDLVAHGRVDGGPAAWLYRPEDDRFEADREAAETMDLGMLFAEAAGPNSPLSFTCVPPGDGRRSALDRDGDGHLDGDERSAGSDPADPESRPGLPTLTPTPTIAPTPTASDAPPGLRAWIYLPKLLLHHQE